MLDILFSLGVIFVLLPIVFIYIISKSNIKLSDKTVVFITISTFSIIVGVLMFPLEINFTGEIYEHYILKIINYEIPLITHMESALPLIYGISVLFFDLTNISLDIYFNLLRMVLFFFYLYGIYLVFSLFKETINIKYKYSFILLVFFISFDFNGTFLFTGDQFRNFLGQTFFIYFIYYYLLNKNLFSFNTMLFMLTAMVSHKLYLIFIPFCVLSYIFYNIFRLKNSFKLTLIIPLFFILLVPILQNLSIYINFLSLNDKLNQPIPIGFELILSSGVLGQLIFHLVIILLILNARNKIKSNSDLMFLTFITIAMLSIGRINLFDIKFVEPSRIYGIMAPFIFILLTVSWYHFLETVKNKIFPILFVIIYFLFSFSLINYSKESFSPHLLLIKQNVFNLDKYFGNNLQLIFYVIIFFVFLMFIDFMVNKILKIKKDIILLIWKYFGIGSLILLVALLINHSFDIYFYLLLILLIMVTTMGKILLFILPKKTRT